MKDAAILDMDNPDTKHRLASKIRVARGLWECYFVPYRLTRSVKQNKYYWVGVVAPFTEWLREAYGDSWITTDQAHEMLKERILGEGVPGKAGTLRPSTATLNTEQFAEYVEKAAAWLAEFCDIVVIPPDRFTIEKEQIKL